MPSSGGGQSAPTTQTQQATPWSGAQPGLQQAISGAQNLFGNDLGYHPYPGSTVTGIPNDLAQGLGAATAMGYQDQFGSTGVNAARSLAEQMQGSQGLSQGQTGYAIPQMQLAVGNYGNVYTDASGQQNPYLLSQIAANDRRIADKINSSMSGAGRYGSGAHTDVMARSLAEAANPILAQDYAQRQQTRLAALGGMQQGLGAISDIYGGGLDRAGKYAQLIPALDQARYAGADRLMGTGQYTMDYQQKLLNDAVNSFNLGEARPWEQVARLNAIASGAGALGGTKISTTTPPAIPTTQKLFGGALAGAGLGSTFGVPGAALGALGGSLYGLLG